MGLRLERDSPWHGFTRNQGLHCELPATWLVLSVFLKLLSDLQLPNLVTWEQLFLPPLPLRVTRSRHENWKTPTCTWISSQTQKFSVRCPWNLSGWAQPMCRLHVMSPFMGRVFVAHGLELLTHVLEAGDPRHWSKPWTAAVPRRSPGLCLGGVGVMPCGRLVPARLEPCCAAVERGAWRPQCPGGPYLVWHQSRVSSCCHGGLFGCLLLRRVCTG